MAILTQSVVNTAVGTAHIGARLNHKNVFVIARSRLVVITENSVRA